jgi:glycosyltransferase involved in cell wall biosynthesis
VNKLLVIGYVWPEPKSSAAGSHMLSLIRLFVENDWQVTFATPAQLTEYNFDLAQLEVSLHTIKINDSSFDHFISELQPNAVVYDRFMMEEQFGWRVQEAAPSALQILDTEDLQCLRNARHEALKSGSDFTLEHLNSDLARREIASIYRCDLSLIISDFELELLKTYFKLTDELLLHVPFMLDIERLTPNPLEFDQRQHFVTIGNLRHAPNWDSILYLQTIWPQIRSAIANAELHIYGAYTPPKATALHNPKMGFLIKDRAECVDQVMRNARVCLAPLRFGAGIKGKFCDAMRVQTPIVTTDIGAEGMTFGQPWPGMIADTANQIADSAIELYQNKKTWYAKQSLCHSLLKNHYDSTKIGQNLITRVNSLMNDLESHRKQNFIGSMLNFHSMRSTKFMSKWIEEKNKSTNKVKVP